MTVGFLVDGEAEFRSLPILLQKITSLRGSLCGRPLRIPVNGGVPPGQIAIAARRQFPVLVQKGATSVVLVIDRELVESCAGALAAEIRSHILRIGLPAAFQEMHVVVKDRMYENWLVADFQAVRNMPRRFELKREDERLVAPNKADRVDALALLKLAARNCHGYDKVDDAVQIARHAEPIRIAQNSRSFRRLLRVVGDPRFLHQSRLPLPQV